METTTVEAPDEDQVRAAISELDGSEHNDLYLHADDGAWMGIAGGPDQIFLSFSESEDGPHFQGFNSAEAPRSVELVIGGQRALLDAQDLWPPAVAQAAAAEFLLMGSKPTCVEWRET